MVSLLDRVRGFDTPAALRDVVDRLARTEDIRFSHDGRRLAIAGFAANTIMILELAAAPSREVTGSLELKHPQIDMPHGLEWLDNTQLAIANRGGGVMIIAVQAPQSGVHAADAELRQFIDKIGLRKPMKSPGSLAVATKKDKRGLWVCNNYINTMSYHTLKGAGPKLRIGRNKSAITKGLKTPDGVAVSHDNAYLAISNHDTHQVFIYAIDKPGKATKIGVLNGIDYPHGLRFAPDSKSLIVADAGQPFLHVFRTDNDWQGKHETARYVRVLTDTTYWHGRHNTQEGGIKGIDIDASRGIVVMTCEMQTLTLVDLGDVLGDQ